MAALMRLKQKRVTMMNTTTAGFIKMRLTQAGFIIPADLRLKRVSDSVDMQQQRSSQHEDSKSQQQRN